MDLIVSSKMMLLALYLRVKSVFCNAAYMGDKCKSGIGLVLRDKFGKLQAVNTLVSSVCTSPLEVEAILQGLRLARTLDVHRVTVMFDSLN